MHYGRLFQLFFVQINISPEITVILRKWKPLSLFQCFESKGIPRKFRIQALIQNSGYVA